MIPHQKIEGSFVLQGMIEGVLADDSEILSKLTNWIEFCEQIGIKFNLRIEDGRFVLLASSVLFNISDSPQSPQDRVRELLSQLVVAVPSEKHNLFSSVRSVEYEPGVAIQTVYPFLPDGSVGCEERCIDSDTKPAPLPITPLEKCLVVLGALLLSIALLLTT